MNYPLDVFRNRKEAFSGYFCWASYRKETFSPKEKKMQPNLAKHKMESRMVCQMESETECKGEEEILDKISTYSGLNQ